MDSELPLRIFFGIGAACLGGWLFMELGSILEAYRRKINAEADATEQAARDAAARNRSTPQSPHGTADRASK